jgi:hypothetical protein
MAAPPAWRCPDLPLVGGPRAAPHESSGARESPSVGRSEHHANDTAGCPVPLAADNACLYVTGRCKGGGKAAWLLYNGVDEGCIVFTLTGLTTLTGLST